MIATPPPHDPANPLKQAAAPPRRRRYLPFAFFWPLLIGAVAGIGLRLTFNGDSDDIYTPMSLAFIALSPLLVGAVTVYVAERSLRRTVGYYFFAPLLANLLYVSGTLLFNIEGWICAVLILPIFALYGAIGGLLMGTICRLTHWPKQTVYCLAVLPILMAVIEARFALPDRVGDLQRTVLIAAPPSEVWRQILHADHIRAEEVDRGWIYRIGVPVPHAGVIEQTADGPVRRITMGKGIHFDQVVTAWQPQRYVHFDYRFAPDSFPPRALDDHVRIGGRFFDLRDTAYSLAPHGEGGTKLTIRMHYRVSTRFNWYAQPLADWLIGDFEDTILGFYRQRSERAMRVAIVQAPAATATPRAPR